MLIRRMLGLEDGQKVDKRKPGHGPCCTCQKCGYDHDNCKCWENAKVEICEYVEATQAENAKLKKDIKKLADETEFTKETQAGADKILQKDGAKATAENCLWLTERLQEACDIIDHLTADTAELKEELSEANIQIKQYQKDVADLEDKIEAYTLQGE